MDMKFFIAEYTVEYSVTGWGRTGRKAIVLTGMFSSVQTELLTAQVGIVWE